MNLQSDTLDDRHPNGEKRILLVEDDGELRTVTQMGLERHGFEVVPAATVNDALRHISAEKFDLLLSDLHMPDAGDGFTVVSAMRYTHPKAVTLVLGGFPAIQESVNAIIPQADEVLLKPIGVAKVTEITNTRLSSPGGHLFMNKERVAAILEWPRIQSDARLFCLLF
jgi:DNA-binding NtrC family response regulator